MRVAWIRSPAFDCFWILSAPVLGLLLVLFPSLLALFLMINFAHAISPIVLGWTHRHYREVMLANPRKFIGVPIGLFVLATIIACVSVVLFPGFKPYKMTLEDLSWDNLSVPIVLWANLYAAWNLYHAGAQNFGFWCLYRGIGYKPGWGKWAVLGAFMSFTLLAGHELPRLIPALFLFTFGLFSFNHSLAEIGLCSHVHSRHHRISPLYFAGCVLLLGIVGSYFFMSGLRVSLFWATMALSLRGALGVWHFLQDRWIWRLSDPRVRATIGADLFGSPKAVQKAAA